MRGQSGLLHQGSVFLVMKRGTEESIEGMGSMAVQRWTRLPCNRPHLRELTDVDSARPDAVAPAAALYPSQP